MKHRSRSYNGTTVLENILRKVVPVSEVRLTVDLISIAFKLICQVHIFKEQKKNERNVRVDTTKDQEIQVHVTKCFCFVEIQFTKDGYAKFEDQQSYHY